MTTLCIPCKIAEFRQWYLGSARLKTKLPYTGTCTVPNNTRQKLADSFSEGTFQLSLPQLDSIHSTEPVVLSWLWPTPIDRQTSNVTYSSSIAHQYTALLTLPDRSRPPIEADTAYQECLPSCELHSRSLAVGRTGTCNLEIAHA